VSRPTESSDEENARHIVSTVLGVPVDCFEDGTAPRQVDALIRYPDRDAALEVVGDHDMAFNAQQDALHRKKNHAIEVSGLHESWTVLLSRTAKIKRVKEALPALLLAMQANPPPRRSQLGYRTRELDRLGIKTAWPQETGTVPGCVYLTPASVWGFAGTEHTAGEWVTSVLVEKAPDVPRKLADHPGVDERHAFIWVRPTSDFGCRHSLSRAMTILSQRRLRRCQQV
jgi:hypothetical protein